MTKVGLNQPTKSELSDKIYTISHNETFLLIDAMIACTREKV